MLAQNSTGRPWLFGDWDNAKLLVLERVDSRLAIFSDITLRQSQFIAETLSWLDARGTLDQLAALFPGNVVVFHADAAGVRCRGSLTEMNRLFLSPAPNVLVSTSARRIAETTKAQLDYDALACRLAYPTTIGALEGRTVWKGIEPIPGGVTAHIDGSGVLIDFNGPTLPKPVDSLVAGARSFRSSLLQSVQARSAQADSLGCDVSGGFDSTTIAFLLAHFDKSFTAFTSGNRSSSDDDPFWADNALAQLPAGQRIHVDPQRMPAPFEGFPDVIAPYEEPFVGTANVERMLFIARQLRRAGVTHHFGGHGGDELLELNESFLPSLLRRNPLLAVKYARGFASMHRWPFKAAARFTLGLGSYAQTIERELELAGSNAQGRPNPTKWPVGPIRFPQWMTTDAKVSAAERIRSEKRNPHDDSWTSSALQTLRASGRITESIRAVYRSEGIELQCPFLDEAVVVSALSMRPEEFLNPYSPKSLLPKSMEGIVPASVYSRRTKSTGLTDAYQGKRINRPGLMEYFNDSRLATVGLIDPDILTQALNDQLHPPVLPIALWRTIAVEGWLRTLD
ncbi:asparagine synthase-related protein [Rhodococcus erythropolis]|uniref:asparagine synthase-related protein n=1 Tax=Rhodococcus erythropolis TaxID=1833 RepID=UPI001E42414C|nr:MULTISPECIES: asparagine synthase-related protein [Rhodococcus erythropolis group]MCD2104875.1 hypothetical protein [Rhodococcus qingshengii]MCZ4524997.1 asparagine synthase-related protein [Rhodococcus erythropolis]